MSKILLTLAVIAAAVFLLRHQSRRRQLQTQLQEQQAEERRRAMRIAITLVVLTLLFSAGIYGWHWQQEHQVISVRVINSNNGAMQRYQVYRHELDGRRFRTIDGIEIHLSDVERMEVLPSQGSANE